MAEGIRPSRLDHCAGCGKDVQRTKTSAADIYCRQCRKDGLAPMRPTRAAHGSSQRYRRGCRCELCRTENARQAKLHQAAARARGYVRPGRTPKAPCPICGELVTASRSGNPMHRECRWKVRNAAARAATKRRKLEDRLVKAAAGVPANPRRQFTMGLACAYCGEGFVRRGKPSPYCSSKCRRRDRPRPVRPSVRQMVLARDGFVCQLCLEPTDPDADPLTDWAPTVDHIVPQSRGGSHDPDNLRCAHRWCNSVRGDLSHYTDADLRLST